MNETRPGYQTTEFWLALGATAMTFLVLTGVVAAADRPTLETALGDLIVKVAAVAGDVAVIVAYIRGRVEVKAARR